MANDLNDPLRAAFTTAWKRGLYQAAYALPRALDPKAVRLTVVKRTAP